MKPSRIILGATLIGVIALSLNTSQEAATWRDDLSLYEADLVRDPRNGYAQYHMGHAINRRFGCEQSLPFFVRATELAPDYGRAWHNVAGCLINLGRFDQAVSPARRAAELRPDHAGAQLNLGIALIGVGETREGISHLERAAQLDPDDPRARELLEHARNTMGLDQSRKP